MMSSVSELDISAGGEGNKTHQKKPKSSKRSPRKPAGLKTCLETSRKKTVTCKFCKKKFRGRKNLESHKKLEHKNEKLPENFISESISSPPPPVNIPMIDLVGPSREELQESVTNVQANKEKLLMYSELESCHPRPKNSAIRKSVYKETCLTQSKKSVRCKLCNKRFLRRKNLYSHVRSDHPEVKIPKPSRPSAAQHQVKAKPKTEAPTVQLGHIESRKPQAKEKHYQCMFCGKVFDMNWRLESHMIVHTKEKPFQCAKCKLSFGRKPNLTQHTKTHSDNDLRCDQCPLLFTRKRYLEDHIKRSHVTETEVNCLKNTEQKLKIPKTEKNDQICTKLPPKNRHKCFKCSKVFAWPSSLRKHMILVHTKPRPEFIREVHESIAAKVGNFSTTGLQPLKNFKVTITGNPKQVNVNITLPQTIEEIPQSDKTFPCSSCPKAFKYKSDLKKHLPTHSDIKPFTCVICQLSFKRKSELTRHEGKPHSLKCDQCILAFCIGKNWKKHWSSAHSDIFQKTAEFCDVDPLMPRLQRYDAIPEPELQLPIPIPSLAAALPAPAPHKSTACKATFPSKASLHQHLWTHIPGMVFPCHRCELKFATEQLLEEHSTIHCASEILKCKKCNLEFPDDILYQLHALTHETLEPVAALIASSDPTDQKSRNKNQCPYCTQVFPSIGQLRSHLLVHLNTKPLNCSVYQASFESPNRLSAHMISHMKTVSLPTKSSMVAPVKAPGTIQENAPVKFPGAIPEKVPFTLPAKELLRAVPLRKRPQDVKVTVLAKKALPVVPRTASVKAPLPVPVKVPTPIPPKVTVTAPSEVGLTVPAKVNSAKEIFSCGLCKKNFSSKSALKSHLRLHENRERFQCSQCHKEIPLLQIEEHMQGHMLE